MHFSVKEIDVDDFAQESAFSTEIFIISKEREFNEYLNLKSSENNNDFQKNIGSEPPEINLG